MPQLRINIDQAQLDAVYRAAAARNLSRAAFVRSLIADATGVADPRKTYAFSARKFGDHRGWAARRAAQTPRKS